MSEQMEFPETFERFAKEYGFKDDKEVYTNGSDLITIFRVKQWLEHDNKLRRIETDTAYDCGYNAGKALLDKIRAEITNIHLTDTDGHNQYWYRDPQAIINDALQIIDKYKAGSEKV